MTWMIIIFKHNVFRLRQSKNRNLDDNHSINILQNNNVNSTRYSVLQCLSHDSDSIITNESFNTNSRLESFQTFDNEYESSTCQQIDSLVVTLLTDTTRIT